MTLWNLILNVSSCFSTKMNIFLLYGEMYSMVFIRYGDFQINTRRLWVVNMAGGSIKLFQFIQIFYQFIGVFPLQSNQKFYWRHSIILICSAQLLVSVIAFLLFDAKLMIDSALGILTVIITIECSILHSISLWESENTLKYIKTCEGFIEKRKYKPNHNWSRIQSIKKKNS